jgi:arginase
MARTIVVLGVPMDLGQSRRGVDMGPSAMRCTGFETMLSDLGHRVSDLGDVTVPVAESLPAGGRAGHGGAAYAEAIATACRAVSDRLLAAPPDAFPIVLGGDHSVAIGSVPGAARGQRTGVIWVDAHTDLNTPETSPSGNVHGMPLAALLGHGDPRLAAPVLRPEDVVVIGARSVDPGERERVRSTGVTVFTMKEVDRLGMARIAAETVGRVRGLDRVHVSFDADALDPEVAPGVGTPVPGGLTFREAHLLMELLADADIVSSLDLVEVNPILDRENRTAKMMCELAASLLGRSII